MKNITDVLWDGQWKGRRCFIVGGGQSLTGFDFSLLREELTIGCNEAWRHRPTVNLCQDREFHQEMHRNRLFTPRPTIPVYKKMCRKPEYCDCFVIGDTRAKWSTSLKEGLVHGNTGLAALCLADLLGASPIFLLGFDMDHWGDGRIEHWHDSYPEAWRPRKSSMFDWIRQFERFKDDVRGDVVNLNQKSGLHCFPKESVHAILG